MPEQDRYGDWLEGFRREVDDALEEASPKPPLPPGAEGAPPAEAVSAMKKAVGEFEDWWRQETADLSSEPEPAEEAEAVSKELELSRREARALQAELERLKADPAAPARAAADEGRRRVAEERARLAARCAELETDNAALRRRETEALERLAELKVDAGKARDAYEARVSRLEADLSAQERAAAALGADRAFLQAEFKRQADRLEAAEAELAEARRRGESLGESQRALAERAEAERRRSAELERRAAALAGEAEALRGQAAALQERLVRAVAPDPGEQARAGLDELKRREQALTTSFEERQRALEARLREATVWLETKLREAGGTA